MSRVTTNDFPFYTPEMFGRSAADMVTLLTTVIAEQAGLLALRVGTLYNATEAETVTLLTRTEKLLVEAELLRLRIVRLVGTVVNGDQADLRPLEKQRQEMLSQSDVLIRQILAGVKVDTFGFAIGVIESGTAHGFPLPMPSC